MTACQCQFKFIVDNYLQNVQNITTIYKPIYKQIYQQQCYEIHKCTDIKVIKNAEHIKAWIELKMFIVLGLMK